MQELPEASSEGSRERQDPHTGPRHGKCHSHFGQQSGSAPKCETNSDHIAQQWHCQERKRCKHTSTQEPGHQSSQQPTRKQPKRALTIGPGNVACRTAEHGPTLTCLQHGHPPTRRVKGFPEHRTPLAGNGYQTQDTQGRPGLRGQWELLATGCGVFFRSHVNALN